MLNRKLIFMVVFLEIRYWFQQNFKLALGIKRVTRNSLAFFTVSQKQDTTKIINCNFLLVQYNLKDIAYKSESIHKSYNYYLDGSISLNKNMIIF